MKRPTKKVKTLLLVLACLTIGGSESSQSREEARILGETKARSLLPALISAVAAQSVVAEV